MKEDSQPYKPLNRRNCLRVAGISCLVASVVCATFGLWDIGILSRNPVFRGFYSAVRLAAECQLHLQNPARDHNQDISGALDRYVARNKEYPRQLADLYPNYLEDRTVLHCPADPRPSKVVSYEYFRPSLNAPGDTIVVRCSRHVIMKGQAPMVLELRKDGHVIREMPSPITSTSRFSFAKLCSEHRGYP